MKMSFSQKGHPSREKSLYLPRKQESSSSEQYSFFSGGTSSVDNYLPRVQYSGSSPLCLLSPVFLGPFHPAHKHLKA